MIPQIRLLNQHIDRPHFRKPDEVVAWLGAVQAQDYRAALWAIGLRTSGATESLVEKALADGSIVRTWPMRRTLHIVPAPDVRWMLKLLSPRMIGRSSARNRQLHLDDATFNRSARILTRALRGGRQFTREEMYRVLEGAHIATANQRGIHILSRLAQDGILCFGPRRESQHTFVLLDEWVPRGRTLEREEALAELSHRFFRSHGPATVQDFSWWSGLSPGDARAGLDLIKFRLTGERANGFEYWTTESAGSSGEEQISLLPAFDEYLVGYRNRADVIRPKDARRINAGGGMLSPAIILRGKVAGTWKRIITKAGVQIDTSPFSKFGRSEQGDLADAAGRYGDFLGLKLITKGKRHE